MPPTGLFPRGGPRPTTSRAEQAVHRALGRALPAGWAAWHSLRVRTRKNWEGEGDFVIGIPDRGILVVEVKGGAVEVRGGQWFQDGRPMPKLPRDQANSFARKLGAKLAERGVREHVPFAICTAFPETAYSSPPSQGDLEGAVIGQQDLPYLAEALGELCERHFDPRKVPADPAWLDALHGLWGETWTPDLKLGHRVELREDALVPLAEEQLAYLDLIDENDRVLMRGGPGTGKTLLARELWLRLRARGRAPVFLCFTSALAAALRGAGVPGAFTVRELAIGLLEELGVPVGGGRAPSTWTPEIWEQASALAAASATPLARERFDAVVVDEAQDLSAADWAFLGAIAEGRPLYAFADEGQAFWPDRPVPSALFGTRGRLTRRYRCPEPLARFADLYRPGEPGGAALPPPRDELRVVRVADTAAVETAVARELQRALDDGAAPRDLAVVSLAGQTRTLLGVRDHLGGLAVRRADAPDAGTHVVADTFLRFKGLERPWIVIVELGLGTTRYDLRMHVALTRATVGCVVVATEGEIAADRWLAGAADPPLAPPRLVRGPGGI